MNTLVQPIISRQYDASHLNSILNHPSVYPYVAGSHEGPLDFTEALEDDNIVALLGEYGGQVYHRRQPGLWEAHSAFLPEGRGPWAKAATQETLRWLFSRTDAVEVLTRCPTLAAKALAKSVGLSHEFTSPTGWVLKGKTVPADVMSITIQGWMKSAPGLVERGRWFHEKLECEFERVGIVEPQHDDDETHDRYVGAACEMVFGGQPQKAVVFYNRVASMMGWHPISIASRDPLTVFIGSAFLVINGRDFYVPSQKSALQHASLPH